MTEQIVGRLAAVIGAPACEVALVELDAIAGWEFRPGSGRFVESGWAHGSVAVDPAMETRGLDHRTDDDNRRRHCGIYALCDWLAGSDVQWLYGVAEDNAYYSHDHGYYLTGPDWTETSLAARRDAPYTLSIPPGQLDVAELSRLADALDGLTRQDIDGELSKMPPDWPVTDSTPWLPSSIIGVAGGCAAARNGGLGSNLHVVPVLPHPLRPGPRPWGVREHRRRRGQRRRSGVGAAPRLQPQPRQGARRPRRAVQGVRVRGWTRGPHRGARPPAGDRQAGTDVVGDAAPSRGRDAQPHPVLAVGAVAADSAGAALELVFDQLVLDAARKSFPFEKKHRAQGAARQAYKAHAVPADAVRERAPVRSGVFEGTFDFAVHNGRTVQLVQCWSFQLPNQAELAEQVKAWSWLVHEVRQAGGALTTTAAEIEVPSELDIYAIAIPPVTGTEAPAYEEAKAAFAENGVIELTPDEADRVGAQAAEALRAAA